MCSLASAWLGPGSTSMAYWVFDQATGVAARCSESSAKLIGSRRPATPRLPVLSQTSCPRRGVLGELHRGTGECASGAAGPPRPLARARHRPRHSRSRFPQSQTRTSSSSCLASPQRTCAPAIPAGPKPQARRCASPRSPSGRPLGHWCGEMLFGRSGAISCRPVSADPDLARAAPSPRP